MKLRQMIDKLLPASKNPPGKWMGLIPRKPYRATSSKYMPHQGYAECARRRQHA